MLTDSPGNLQSSVQDPYSAYYNRECVNCGVIHASQWRPDGAGNYLCSSCANFTCQLDNSQLSNFTLNASPDPEPFEPDFPKPLSPISTTVQVPSQPMHKNGCCRDNTIVPSQAMPITPTRRQVAPLIKAQNTILPL